jgi:hypothetical protein
VHGDFSRAFRIAAAAVPADCTAGVDDANAGVDFANAVVDVVGEGDFGAGSLSLKSFIRGFVVALVPLVLSLSAFAAASFGFAAAHWSIADPAGFAGVAGFAEGTTFDPEPGVPGFDAEEVPAGFAVEVVVAGFVGFVED